MTTVWVVPGLVQMPREGGTFEEVDERRNDLGRPDLRDGPRVACPGVDGVGGCP